MSRIVRRAEKWFKANEGREMERADQVIRAEFLGRKKGQRLLVIPRGEHTKPFEANVLIPSLRSNTGDLLVERETEKGIKQLNIAGGTSIIRLREPEVSS
jgi:hypothetical protein